MSVQVSPKVLVLIQEDPFKSHRAVEALRIALGLGSANEGKDVNIVLAGRAPHLLSDDTTNIVDAEILEKHLPVFIEWGTSFAIASDAERPAQFHSECAIRTITQGEISSAVAAADRVLVF